MKGETGRRKRVNEEEVGDEDIIAVRMIMMLKMMTVVITIMGIS